MFLHRLDSETHLARSSPEPDTTHQQFTAILKIIRVPWARRYLNHCLARVRFAWIVLPNQLGYTMLLVQCPARQISIRLK